MTRTLLTALAVIVLAAGCYADTSGYGTTSSIDHQQCWRDGGEVMVHIASDRTFCDVHDDVLLFDRHGRITKPDYWMELNHTDFDFESHAAKQHAAPNTTEAAATTTTTATTAASNADDATVCVAANSWTQYTRNAGAFGFCLAAVDYHDAPFPPVLHIDCNENRTIQTAILTPYPLTDNTDSTEAHAVVEWWQKNNPTQGSIGTWFTDGNPQSAVTPQTGSVFLDQLATLRTGTLIINFISVDDYDPEADKPDGIYTAEFDITGADHYYETISRNCR